MSESKASKPNRGVPEHLPKRLAITMPAWRWLTDGQPGEPWADLDAYFGQMVERGYNTARVDAMLNWAYEQDGTVRGPVEVGCVVDPGFITNSGGLVARGGGRVRALDAMLDMCRVAEKHDVYLSLTSWEYHPGHTTTFVADKALRDEISGIPADEKLMAHARKYDLLLTRLEQEGLVKRIAFVEIHNELSVLTQFFGGPDATKRHTEEALAYLQTRHPNMLFCGDYVGPWSSDLSFDYKAQHGASAQYADNTQVVDHHLYAFGVQAEFLRRAGIWTALEHFYSQDFDLDDYMARLVLENEFFKSFQRPDALSWQEYRPHFRADSPWQPVVYFYEYLDTDAYDYWMFRHFHEYEDRMTGYWKNTIQFMGQLGHDKNLPVVCDEGYVFYPPQKSQFEPNSPVGRHWIEFVVDHMLEEDYWGIIVPVSVSHDPLWATGTTWLQRINQRITA